VCEQKLQAEQNRLEQLRNDGKGDSHEFEAFMG
jgi:exonuclease VII small subunit